MIKVLIIEDEKAAQDHLLELLQELDMNIKTEAVISNVKEAIQFLSEDPDIDLILSDVQLPDGMSFDIFRNTSVKTPVIFVTGFDQFMISAFETNGIDYLLKPASGEELRKAIQKYKMLEKHFTSHNLPLKNLLEGINGKKKTRLIVKKGIENISLRYEDIIMCYTDQKVVYVVDRSESKYMVDKTLNELEEELNKDMFFRANRQYIVNLNFVKSFRPYEKVKLLLDLQLECKKHLVIISQLTAPLFRKWIAEA